MTWKVTYKGWNGLITETYKNIELIDLVEKILMDIELHDYELLSIVRDS